MVSFLVVGDLHAKLSSLLEINKLKEELIKNINSYNPNHLILLGDFQDSHEKIHLQVWNCIIDFFVQISEIIPIYYLIGNHDALNNQIFLTDEHFFKAFKFFKTKYPIKIIDRPVIEKFGSDSVIFCPYTSTGRLQEALSDFHVNDASLVFGHQEIKGAVYNSIISQNGDSWDSNFPLFINGHIHTKQWIGNNVFYPGTPYQTNFGENDDKFIHIVELENKKINIKEIGLSIFKKITINSDISINLQDLDDNVNYRIIINDTLENIAKFKIINKNNMMRKNIKFIYKPVDKVNTLRNTDKDDYISILKKYIEKEPDSIKDVFTEMSLNVFTFK